MKKTIKKRSGIIISDLFDTFRKLLEKEILIALEVPYEMLNEICMGETDALSPSSGQTETITKPSTVNFTVLSLIHLTFIALFYINRLVVFN